MPRAGAAAADSPAPVWIFLKDKGVQSNPAGWRQSAEEVRRTLSPDALRRRDLRGIGLNDDGVNLRDLPVASSYARAIADTGADIRVRSKWLNAVSVIATPQELEKIRALPFVGHVQPVARVSSPQALPKPVPPAGGGSAGPEGSGPEDFYGYASFQLQQIKIPQVHALGYTGAGVKIGVLDSGFSTSHLAFNAPGRPLRVLAEWDFVENDGDTSDITNDQHVHGTHVLGCIGAYRPDVLVGGAYDASFMLAKTEDLTQEVPAEEDLWVAGLEFLENSGADVVTSSLGYIDWYTQNQMNGQTAVTSVAAAAAAERGLAITNAAGNYGHDDDPATSQLPAPADADLLITVGAVEGTGEAAWFSSDGPTADLRVKPEVMALGSNVRTVGAWGTTSTAFVDGTSFATPLVASAVSLIIQAHPDWSVEQIRHALFQTASRGGTFDPLYVHGYGIVDTLAAVQYSFDKPYVSPTSGSWDDAGNWLGSSLPLPVHDVAIAPASAGTNVTVTGPTVPTRIHRLTIGGTGSATLDLTADATLRVDSYLRIESTGALVQDAGTLSVGGTTINDGALAIGSTAHLSGVTGSGSLSVEAAGELSARWIRQSQLGISGEVSLRPAGTPEAASRVRELSLSGGASPVATLDLADNAMVIDYDGISPSSVVRQQLRAGAETGVGIVSTMGVGYAVGYAEASELAVVPAIFGDLADSTSLLLRGTRAGDANLDGDVNLPDFNRLAAHFGTGGGATWMIGDFNYDGVVNLADFNALAGNFGLGAGPDGAVDPRDWAALAAAVPEPMVGTIGLGLSLLLVRARRR